MTERLAAGYRNFAEHEARGRSPLYVELAAGVAEDRELLQWLAGLPVGKRQPNLVFAAVRALAGTPDGWCAFRAVLSERRDEVEALILTHRTQTNEATLVVLHTAVLPYVPAAGRAAFRAAVAATGATWIACEAPDVLGLDRGPPGLFALALDGRLAGWADPHGAALTWAA